MTFSQLCLCFAVGAAVSILWRVGERLIRRILHQPALVSVSAPWQADVLALLDKASNAPFEIQAIMREHGFAVDNLAEPWQKMYFTLFTHLVGIASDAKALLPEEEDKP